MKLNCTLYKVWIAMHCGIVCYKTLTWLKHNSVGKQLNYKTFIIFLRVCAYMHVHATYNACRLQLSNCSFNLEVFNWKLVSVKFRIPWNITWRYGRNLIMLDNQKFALVCRFSNKCKIICFAKFTFVIVNVLLRCGLGLECEYEKAFYLTEL